MKIEEIRLQNIYSHEDTCIELGDTPYAVVIGDNGAGKSSLFTTGPLFALFGSSATDTVLADVLRHGAEQGTATITFSLGGQRYRVSRTYSVRTKSGKTDLEFLKETPEGWKAEQTGSTSEVEAAIERLLGADHKAITLGSIMQQGKAGEFTAATPAKRIEALSRILGIDYYRDAFTLSGQKMRDLDTEIEKLTAQIDREEERLEDKEAAEEAARLAEKQLEDCADPLPTADAAADVLALERQSEEIRKAMKRVEELRQQKKRLEADRAKLVEKKGQIKAEIDKRETQIDGWLEAAADLSPPNDNLETELKKAEADHRAARNISAKISDLDEKLVELRGDWREQKAQVDWFEGQIEKFKGGPAWARGVDLFGPDFEEWPGKAEELVADIEELVDKKQEEFGKVKALGQKINPAEVELSKLEQRHSITRDNLKGRMRALDLRPESVPMETCNPCGLLEDALKAKAQLEEMGEECEEAKALKEKISGWREEMEANKSKLGISTYQELTEVIAKEREPVRPAQEAATVSTEVAALEEKLKEARAKLQKTETLAADTKESKENHQHMLAQDFGDGEAEGAVERLKDRIRDLLAEKADAEKRAELTEKIAGAEKAKKELRLGFEDIEGDLEDFDKTIADVDESLEDWGADEVLEKHEAVSNQLKTKRGELDELREENDRREKALSAAREELAKARAKLEGFEGLEEQIAGFKAEVADLTRARQEFEYSREFLKLAPQIVIGSALPRLEADTNEILKEIGPEFRVSIERQRDTRSGSTRDEIHILVRTGGIPQPYENYSGGEQFRIDIAMRLALARAASRRAGSRQLKTLVLDEGWGSLDHKGKEALKDTMVRLQQRFDNIYVITHVDEVRDLFPAIVELSRDSSKTKGSRVEIIQ